MGRKVECVDCHFFAKTSCLSAAARHTFVIGESERALARKGDFSWVGEADALWCYRGLWDEGRGSDRARRFEIVTDARRKKSCFFMPFRNGISLPAAVDLSKRDADSRSAGRSRVPAWVGVAVAAIGILVAYLIVAVPQNWWPF